MARGGNFRGAPRTRQNRWPYPSDNGTGEDMYQGAGSTPIPDPTKLTQAAVKDGVATVREILEAEIDGDGRLVLPQKLREKIGLTDSAFFISAGDSLKVWNPAAYADEERRLEELVPEFEPGADPLSLLTPSGGAEV